jgi:hypothetical protein
MQLRLVRRYASLTVISETLTVGEITEALGQFPDDSLSRGERRPGSLVPVVASANSWRIQESSESSSIPVEQLLESLLARVVPLREALTRLSNKGSSIQVSVVQWISTSDGHGPGFGLDSQSVRLIAEIGASFDVDQYVESNEDLPNSR